MHSQCIAIYSLKTKDEAMKVAEQYVSVIQNNVGHIIILNIIIILGHI